jgi:Bacterial SH3 domain
VFTVGWSIDLTLKPATALRVLLASALLAGAVGCGSSGKRAVPPPPSSTSSTTRTTVASGTQASGYRTVLSPIGLNVRAEPSPSARILGRAAQGVVLTVLGHTAASGGWFEVRGATVTGWISGDPSLSAPGEYRTYTSSQFGALYPATWTVGASPPAGTVFRSTADPDNYVVTPAVAESRLANGRVGYGQTGSQQVVVCGVTSNLVTFQSASSTRTTLRTSTKPTALPYLAQVLLTLDAHHALGLYANLSNLGPSLQSFQEFLASVSFPFPQCIG